jgi:RimJ/RimL family protein N-acetyltransferase
MHLPATIATERLTLRQFEIGDLEGYVGYYTGPRTAGVGGPKPRYVVIERFMAMIGQWALRGFGRYAIAQDGAAFGHAGVMQIDEVDPPEMTWTLWDDTREGQGFATEASRAIVAAWQGPALLARIAPDNTRSQKMAERLGFALDPDAVPPSYAPEFLTYRQGAA